MRKGELSSLTGIRFYAALLVYVYHVVLTIPGVNALSVSSLFSNAADVGVSFFFILSGFILTYNYADVFRDGISDRKSTRLNSSHITISYAVFCLKKKK